MARNPLYTLINGVPTFHWSPHSDYAPGVEVISIPHLVRRGNAQTLNRSARFEFFMLLGVNSGETGYSIDFEQTQTRSGTWLLARPNQVHVPEKLENLDGWAISFRADFLPPGESRQQSFFHPLSGQLADFPNLIQLGEDEHTHCCGIVENLLTDLKADLDEPERNGLLLFQLCTLLMRLRIFHRNQKKSDQPILAQDVVRIAKLRKLIDQHFNTQQNCAWYADKLGCSIKTLGRSRSSQYLPTPTARRPNVPQRASLLQFVEVILNAIAAQPERACQFRLRNAGIGTDQRQQAR